MFMWLLIRLLICTIWRKMTKLTFLTANKSDWGDKQQIMYEEFTKLLASGRDFSVEYKENKSSKQLRAYWRLVGLVFPFLQQCYKGDISSTEEVSNFLKIECGYFKAVKTKTKEIVLAKSLKEASKQELMMLIDKLLFLCEFFGVKDYELTSDEEKALNEFYNIKQ